MNSIIKKTGIQIGLFLSIIQIAIILYLYFFGSFTDLKIGMLSIIMTILLGVVAIIINKKRLKNKISLRESFTGYFITILISIIASNIFYVSLFHTIANESKKEQIKKEFYVFSKKNMKEFTFSKEDYEKNIELQKDFDPFSINTSFQKSIKFLLLYSVFGILASVIFRNKSSFQEIEN
jgi:hypothetical protein